MNLNPLSSKWNSDPSQSKWHAQPKWHSQLDKYYARVNEGKKWSNIPLGKILKGFKAESEHDPEIAKKIKRLSEEQIQFYDHSRFGKLIKFISIFFHTINGDGKKTTADLSFELSCSVILAYEKNEETTQSVSIDVKSEPDDVTPEVDEEIKPGPDDVKPAVEEEIKPGPDDVKPAVEEEIKPAPDDVKPEVEEEVKSKPDEVKDESEEVSIKEVIAEIPKTPEEIVKEQFLSDLDSLWKTKTNLDTQIVEIGKLIIAQCDIVGWEKVQDSPLKYRLTFKEETKGDFAFSKAAGTLTIGKEVDFEFYEKGDTKKLKIVNSSISADIQGWGTVYLRDVTVENQQIKFTGGKWGLNISQSVHMENIQNLWWRISWHA